MVYRIHFEVDGGCRYQGTPDAIGAAAALRVWRDFNHTPWTRPLPDPDDPDDPLPTSQRAELEAIILALEKSLDEIQGLDYVPRVSVTIDSDSKCAIGCITGWTQKWSPNGYFNAPVRPVADLDLIEDARGLEDELKKYGTVEYSWVPREQNRDADWHCRQEMDNIEDEEMDYTDYDEMNDMEYENNDTEYEETYDMGYANEHWDHMEYNEGDYWEYDEPDDSMYDDSEYDDSDDYDSDDSEW